MNKIVLYSIFLIAGFWPRQTEAQRMYQGEICIIQNRFEQKGDSLFLQMDINLSGIAVKPRHALEIIPVLVTDSFRMELPKVILLGKNKQKVYQRSYALIRKKENQETVYFTKVIDGRKTDTINYQISVPFHSWMSSAVLEFNEDFCGCAGKRQFVSLTLLPAFLQLEKTDIPQPQTDTISQPSGMPVIHTLEGSAYLNFPLGQSRITESYGHNRQELAKIHNQLDELLKNQKVKITRIELIGYASPEGSFSFNEKLSQKRAEALSVYLQLHYSLPHLIYINWQGEDWGGLAHLITDADMPQKGRILEIIENTPIHDGREKKLMLLDNGNTYRYMLDHFFPKLRRVDYKIFYEKET